MAALGHPIVGDNLYASDDVVKLSNRLLLHAHRLEFFHPGIADKRMSFCSPSPFSLTQF